MEVWELVKPSQLKINKWNFNFSHESSKVPHSMVTGLPLGSWRPFSSKRLQQFYKLKRSLMNLNPVEPVMPWSYESLRLHRLGSGWCLNHLRRELRHWWLILGVVDHHLCWMMVVPGGHRWPPLLKPKHKNICILKKLSLLFSFKGRAEICPGEMALPSCAMHLWVVVWL